MLETESDLREVIGSPTELVSGKVSDRLNDIFREYIERSPFVCVASSRETGRSTFPPAVTPQASSASWTSARC